MKNKGHIKLQKNSPKKNCLNQEFGRTVERGSKTWQDQIKDNREYEILKRAFSCHSFPFIQSEDEKEKSIYK